MSQLFFFYLSLSFITLAFTLFCLLDELVGSPSLVGIYVTEIGWFSLLVFEFMVSFSGVCVWRGANCWWMD
jgi:hypothetical protein